MSGRLVVFRVCLVIATTRLELIYNRYACILQVTWTPEICSASNVRYRRAHIHEPRGTDNVRADQLLESILLPADKVLPIRSSELCLKVIANWFA